jgi:hypothetical protein
MSNEALLVWDGHKWATLPWLENLDVLMVE